MDQKITDLDVAISMSASDLIPIVDSNGDNKVLHGSQVKDYVADAVVSDIDDVKAMISDEYDNTATYAVGDYCIYNNTLYRCTTAILAAEDFTPAHWTETSIDAEFTAANSAINGKQDYLSKGTGNLNANDLININGVYRCVSGNITNCPNSDGNLIVMYNGEGNSTTQMFIPSILDYLYIRITWAAGTVSWSTWRKVALSS